MTTAISGQSAEEVDMKQTRGSNAILLQGPFGHWIFPSTVGMDPAEDDLNL